MFERYTEKARRVIFFARYEASQFGSPYIETEHLLLGLLREDKALTNRFLRSRGSVESIRKQIEAYATIREKVSTSVDLPLSNESKRVLAFAAEEAERMGNKHIGPEHLFLGLLREDKSFAAAMLTERGIKLKEARKEIAENPPPPPLQRGEALAAQANELFRDLTQAAMEGHFEPVVRREREIDALIEVLSCRQRNCALLVGERGVGKTAIIESLAQRIAEGSVPAPLAEKRLISIDPAQVAGWTKGQANLVQIAAAGKTDGESSRAVLVLDDLADILAAADRARAANAVDMLRYTMLRAEIQCVASCTPAEFLELVEKVAGLVECFRPLQVRPLDEEAALEILRARKESLEKFHDVRYADEAIDAAVRGAAKHLPGTPLPGKALELLDAAGARVKLRQTSPPPEIAELQKKIKFIAHRMESAIQSHEFEKARFYSEEEKKERENLRVARERISCDDAGAMIVGAKEIEEVLASWGGYTGRP